VTSSTSSTTPFLTTSSCLQPLHFRCRSTQPTNDTLYPALYLYPLDDIWAPKHIPSLTSTKIGRQRSSKTAPGQRNGFFDSKIRSVGRQWQGWHTSVLCFFEIHSLFPTRYISRMSEAPTVHQSAVDACGQELEPVDHDIIVCASCFRLSNLILNNHRNLALILLARTAKP